MVTVRVQGLKPTTLESLASHIPSDGPRVDLTIIPPWETPIWARKLTHVGAGNRHRWVEWLWEETDCLIGSNTLHAHVAGYIHVNPNTGKTHGGAAAHVSSSNGSSFTPLGHWVPNCSSLTPTPWPLAKQWKQLPSTLPLPLHPHASSYFPLMPPHCRPLKTRGLKPVRRHRYISTRPSPPLSQGGHMSGSHWCGLHWMVTSHCTPLPISAHTSQHRKTVPQQNIVSSRRPIRRHTLGCAPSPSGHPIGTWNAAGMTSRCAGRGLLKMAMHTPTPSTLPRMATTTPFGIKQWTANTIKMGAKYRVNSCTQAAPPPLPYNSQSTMHSQAPMPNAFARRTPLRPLPANVDTHCAPLAMSSWTVPSYLSPASTWASSTSMKGRLTTGCSHPPTEPCAYWTSSRKPEPAHGPNRSLPSHSLPLTLTDPHSPFTPRPTCPSFFCPHTANQPSSLLCGPCAHLLILLIL